MFKLTQDYTITATKPVVHIFDEIKRKQEYQKKNGSFWDIINYKAFNLSINRIEIQRNPSMLNPYRGLGTIIFQFEENESETRIKCSIDSFGSWQIFAMLFMMGMFLLMLTALILINANGNYPLIFGCIILMWTFGLGMIYLCWRLNLLRLKSYSKSILRELTLIS